MDTKIEPGGKDTEIDGRIETGTVSETETERSSEFGRGNQTES